MAATRGARGDEEKARAVYDWVVANTYREPKVRGCGEGDIKTMLETGNLGGKCADLNALFVGLCRSVGVPARDVYGLRLAPSAFGYKELGGNPASLKGAQHCRAEVFLQGARLGGDGPGGRGQGDAPGNAAVDQGHRPPHRGAGEPRAVRRVEGNWVAWNTAHDIALPHSKGPKLGFFMYPTGENAEGRFDSYSPDDFKYQITARELPAVS